MVKGEVCLSVIADKPNASKIDEKGKRGLLAHLSDLDHSSMHLCVFLSAPFFF